MSEENKNFNDSSDQTPVEKDVENASAFAKLVKKVMDFVLNLDKKTIAIIGGSVAAIIVVVISLVLIIGGNNSSDDDRDNDKGSSSDSGDKGHGNENEEGSIPGGKPQIPPVAGDDENDPESGDDENDPEGGNGENDPEGGNGENDPEGGNGENDPEGDNTEIKEPQVYKEYGGLKRIDSYHNGRATFMIYESSSTIHWGSSGSWNGTYLYGFIDTEGNVIVEPIYECSPHVALPDFKYNYTKVGDLDDHEYIIDKNGNVIFEVGKGGVSGIGNISEGYFWVETYTEEFEGNVYVVNYYSADDLSVAATFENIRAIPNQRTIGGKNSNLSSTGEGLLAYNLNQSSYYDDDLFFFNIADYDTNYAPEVDNWSVDISNMEEFASITNKYYNISGTDNTDGQFATVALKNKSNVWFYSIVDSNGNIVLQPQRDIAFPYGSGGNSMDLYEFCKDLCPAQDANSGYWGYVNTKGEWAIKPQFYSAGIFSSDGYAVINEKIVIDTEGNIVVAPAGWVNSIVVSLSGTYSTSINSYYYYLTFTEDGIVTIEERTSGFSRKREGNYQLLGSTLTVTDMGAFYGSPFSGDGVYSFRKEGNTIYIDDTSWSLRQ